MREKTHHVNAINELLESYGEHEAALMIGCLSGVITRRQAMIGMRCEPEVFEVWLENAKRAAVMIYENQEHMDAIMGGHGLPGVDDVKD